MIEYWVRKPLGEVCEVYQPSTIPKKKMKVDGEYKVFGANGIIGRFDEYNHENSELLLSCRGTCGTTLFSEPYSWINGNAMVVRPLNDNIDKKFLKYLFDGGVDIDKAISGAIQQQITRKSLSKLEVPIPPLSEQKRIVAILDETFEAIDRAKANVERNIANAQELFESKLEAIISKKDQEGEEKRLGDVCAIVSGLVDPSSEDHIDDHHIGGKNMVSGTGELIDLKTSREEGLISGKYPFDETMVLYNKIRPYLKKVGKPEFKGICSSDVYPLKPDEEKITRDFLYFLLISRPFTNYAIEGSARAGMPKVNRNHLFNFKFSIPPIERQKTLVEELNSCDQLVRGLYNTYYKKLNALSELRSSLLQKAFQGELSENVQEEVAA